MFGIDLIELIKVAGYTGLVAIIFAESGLLIGFFFPGDSLLFTAGFLASQGFFDIRLLAILCFVAAVVGDSVGYAFGYRVGRKIFNREESLFFHKDHLLRAERFYEKHGGKTIILARFMPVVRTFAPIIAGIGAMRYAKFIVYNIIGGLLWAVGLSTLGYFLGSTIPDVDRYLVPIVVVIIILSVLPTSIHMLRNADDRQRLRRAGRQVLRKVIGR